MKGLGKNVLMNVLPNLRIRIVACCSPIIYHKCIKGDQNIGSEL